MIVYTGLIAFVTTIAVTLIYRENTVSIPPSTVPPPSVWALALSPSH